MEPNLGLFHVILVRPTKTKERRKKRRKKKCPRGNQRTAKRAVVNWASGEVRCCKVRACHGRLGPEGFDSIWGGHRRGKAAISELYLKVHQIVRELGCKKTNNKNNEFVSVLIREKLGGGGGGGRCLQLNRTQCATLWWKVTLARSMAKSMAASDGSSNTCPLHGTGWHKAKTLNVIGAMNVVWLFFFKKI